MSPRKKKSARSRSGSGEKPVPLRSYLSLFLWPVAIVGFLVYANLQEVSKARANSLERRAAIEEEIRKLEDDYRQQVLDLERKKDLFSKQLKLLEQSPSDQP